MAQEGEESQHELGSSAIQYTMEGVLITACVTEADDQQKVSLRRMIELSKCIKADESYR